jgi:hypothetical protein
LGHAPLEVFEQPNLVVVEHGAVDEAAAEIGRRRQPLGRLAVLAVGALRVEWRRRAHLHRLRRKTVVFPLRARAAAAASDGEERREHHEATRVHS